MTPGTWHEKTVPLLVLGAVVGVLLGVSIALLSDDLFEDDEDGPMATRAEVETAAASMHRIQMHCGARRRARPTEAQRTKARRALSRLLATYRRQPERRFRLDDSAAPMPLDAALQDIIFNTFDGPCPEIARRAKGDLLRTP